MAPSARRRVDEGLDGYVDASRQVIWRVRPDHGTLVALESRRAGAHERQLVEGYQHTRGRIARRHCRHPLPLSATVRAASASCQMVVAACSVTLGPQWSEYREDPMAEREIDIIR